MAILPHTSSCRAWGKTERIVSNITPCDMKCKVYVPPPSIDDGLLTVFFSVYWRMSSEDDYHQERAVCAQCQVQTPAPLGHAATACVL
jgi:hypothetical protein